MNGAGSSAFARHRLAWLTRSQPARWLLTGTLATAVGVLAATPFLLPGFPAARDSLSHLFRLWAVLAAVRQGDLLPRWLEPFAFGYGYPLFNYYGPLLYGLAALPALLGADLLLALRLAVIGTVVGAALGAFLLASALWGRAAGLVAAAGYVAAPYFQTDLLVRGAFPEVLGMALLPWALLAVHRQSVIGLALATALLILAHNAAALIGLACVAGYALWRVLAERSGAGAFRRLDGLLLGLLLAAFFWLPAVAELGEVWLGGPAGQPNFLAALVPVPPLAGPAGSAQSPLHALITPVTTLVQPRLLHDYREVPGAFLAAGLVQVALALAGLPFLLRQGGLPFLVVLILSLTLMTTLSAPLWERVPLATLMAFPWRLQAAVALATALLAAGLARAPLPAGGRWCLAVAAALAALLAGLADARPALLDTAPAALNAAGFAKFERFSTFIGTTSPVQFLPRTVTVEAAALPQATTPPPVTAAPLPHVTLAGDGLFRVSAEQATTLRLHQFFFPGWRARRDGQELPLRGEPPRGVLALDLPPGEHLVALQFEPTWPRRLGAALSGVGAVLLLFAWRWWRRRGWLIALVGGLAAAAALLLPLGRPLWPGFTPRAGEAGAFQLLGIRLEPAREVLMVHALWQVRAAPGEGWYAIVQLEDSAGQVLARSEREPRAGTVSAASWQVGEVVEDVQLLALPPGLPGGSYQLQLGWQGPGTPPTLTPAGSVALPPTPPRPPLTLPPLQDGAFVGGIRLVAGEAQPVLLLPLGLTPPWPALLGEPAGRAGLEIRLRWEADPSPTEDYGIFVTLRQGGTVLAQTNSFPPLDQRYPSVWPAGWPVEQRFLLPLPSVAEGPYEVTAGLFQRQTLQRLRTLSGTDQVVVQRLRRPAAPPAVAIDRALGPVRLAGYDRRDSCPAPLHPPCTLAVRLVWQAPGPLAEPLTVFLHLVGPDGQLVSQHDGPPNGGLEPTTDWSPGLVADPRQLVVPAAAPAGEYRVLVGLYRRDGSRLPAGEGDALELFRLVVAEPGR
jgi:hypothetical protein